VNEREEAELARLERVVKDTAGWSILLYMWPPGDVQFLAPLVPELRGYEIVAADPNGGYDLWREGDLERTDLTLTELSEWLRRSTPPDDVIIAEGAGWVEELFAYYGVPKLAN
jgi:hypothetical protein